MWIFLIGCGVIEFGGLFALLLSKHDNAAKTAASLFTLLGCAVAAIPVVQTLSGDVVEPLQMAWRLPIGEFHVDLDALSAFFMLPVLLLAPLTEIYGVGYLKHQRGAGAHYFFLNTLVASMMLLLCSCDAILFLILWEVMAIASFFLVTFDDHLPSVREAGWIYMIATHIGVMALLAFFAILGYYTGSFDFARISSAGELPPPLKTVLFLLALVGFGSKAGIFPLHIWLPDAHPAAPSHVSALMSGAMIKMGIYGLLRSLSLFHDVEALWGWLLLSLGVVAGIVGIVSALSQHDIKRMLAYSSVENIGIICVGLGAGMLGTAWRNPAVAALGYSGALLHVLNHSVFKGLLFLSAGAVVHETETKEMNHLGGLLKKMPFTATLFFVGAMAASALPPLNGFVSEFLIYASGIQGALAKDLSSIIFAAVVMTALALIGGLAAAAFTKTSGLMFLGEPRTDLSKIPRDPDWTMKLPPLLLALSALALGIAAPWVLSVAVSAQASLVESDPSLLTIDRDIVPSLKGISLVSTGIVIGFALIASLYSAVTKRKGCRVEVGPVWDCGYAKPAARMQYTPSSFSAPLVALFKPLVRIQTALIRPEGYFPKEGRLETEVADRVKDALFAPLFRLTARVILTLRILQHGHVHIYVIYIAATLIALLFITAGN